jgi:hypothetical protein
MREEFLLDALVDYQIEPEDPTRTIPDPECRALDKQIRAARADLAKLERKFGAAAAAHAAGFVPLDRHARSEAAVARADRSRPDRRPS